MLGKGQLLYRYGPLYCHLLLRIEQFLDKMELINLIAALDLMAQRIGLIFLDLGNKD